MTQQEINKHKIKRNTPVTDFFAVLAMVSFAMGTVYAWVQLMEWVL